MTTFTTSVSNETTGTFDSADAAMAAARSMVESRGYRVSAGSYEPDHRFGCVFSVESWGPGTYGHPKFTVMVYPVA